MRVRGIAAIALGTLALLPSGVAGALTTPQLSGAVSGDGEIDDARLVDTATLAGSDAATGTITFSLFGPDDPTCGKAPLTTDTADVHGDGEYRSLETFVDDIGDYRFVAAYSGDAANAAVATDCADADQQATIEPASPTLVSTASPAVTIGQQISDAARLTEAYAPTGEISFALYGPDDSACTGPPVATSAAPLSEDARATSAPFTPTRAGVYRWIASYVGDAFNLPVSGACGDPGESVVVSEPAVVPPAPSLTVRGSAAATVGGQISATATLASLGSLTGVLTFRVYGPGDTQCARGALSASTRTVFGPGEYTSDPFAPKAEGTYRWVVDYSGGVGAATSSACENPAAVVSVAPAPDPVPVLGRSFTVSDVDGTVRVKPAAGAARRRATAARGIGFVAVHGTQSVPVGSTIDATRGTAGLGAATTTAAIQSGDFSGASFVARQPRGGSGVELVLRTPASRRAGCAVADRSARSAKRKGSSRVLRKLHSRVRGHFHVRSRYSSASARRANWTTLERCDGTLTRVGSGTVRVTDRRLHRTVALHAGDKYLARPR